MLVLGVAATYTCRKTETNEDVYNFFDAGQDPPDGVIVHYYFQEAPEAEVTLTFMEASGEVMKRFSSVKDEVAPQLRRAAAKAGMNRFVWNMTIDDAVKIKDDTTVGVAGPMVSPGRYKVQLAVGDFVQTAEFQLLQDPRVAATADDQAAKFDLLRQIRDKQTEAHEAINRLRDVRTQVENWLKRVEDEAVHKKGEALKEGLTAVEEALFQTKAKGRADFLNYPSQLVNKLADLPNAMASSDSAPTRQTYEVFEHLSAQIDEQLANLEEVLETDVPAFNALVQKAGAQAVVVG
jgi:hypothetical protein